MLLLLLLLLLQLLRVTVALGVAAWDPFWAGGGGFGARVPFSRNRADERRRWSRGSGGRGGLRQRGARKTGPGLGVVTVAVEVVASAENFLFFLWLGVVAVTQLLPLLEAPLFRLFLRKLCRCGCCFFFSFVRNSSIGNWSWFLLPSCRRMLFFFLLLLLQLLMLLLIFLFFFPF